MKTTYEEFQVMVNELGQRGKSQEEVVLHAAMGIGSEAGEIVGDVKQIRFQGHPVDKHHILLECGDLLFYIELMLTELDETIESAMRANICKLRTRYPDGFSCKKSMNRNLAAEDKASKEALK